MIEITKEITLENNSGKIKLSVQEVEHLLRSLISTKQILIERVTRDGIYKKVKNVTLSSGPHNVYFVFSRGE